MNLCHRLAIRDASPTARAELVEAWVDSRSVPFGEVRCRSIAAAGDLLFFASPTKTKEKKGDPGVCVPPLRCGQLAVLAPSGVPLELAALKQSRGLIRLKLRSSAHTQGFCGRGSGSDSDADSGSGSRRAVATVFIAAHALFTWARGQKHLRNRRAVWFLRSDRNFAAQHPQGAPKARRIWALTPKTPESASAPDSIPQTPCGRAEQRRLGRIKILDVRRLRSRLVSKISGPDEQRKESRSDPDFGSPSLCLLSLGEARESESPAAATERHRNSAQGWVVDSTQGFDKLSPNGFKHPLQEVNK